MNINGVSVYVDVNVGRTNGKRKLLKALNECLENQDFDSVEDCISTIKGYMNAIEVDYTIDEGDGMSIYAEYAHGLIDEDEFNQAVRDEEWLDRVREAERESEDEEE